MANRPLIAKRDENNYVYEKRIKSYIELIWKISYAHNIFNDLSLSAEDTAKTKKLKAYVGPGNNCSMIKSLIKRRFWWTVSDSMNSDDISFVWTQIKINSIFESQPKSIKRKAQYTNSDDEENEK